LLCRFSETIPDIKVGDMSPGEEGAQHLKTSSLLREKPPINVFSHSASTINAIAKPAPVRSISFSLRQIEFDAFLCRVLW
jgi:hypothetical protein